MAMMDKEDTMQGETGMDNGKPGMGNQQPSEESVSVFLPKAITMGKTFKPGDEIVLKITDVDSETGDLEAVYATDDEHEEGMHEMGEGGMADEFDKEMDSKGY